MISKRPLQLVKPAAAALIALALLFLLFFDSTKLENVFYDVIFRIQNLINSQPLLGALSFLLLSALSAVLAFASSILLVPSAILVWGMPLTFFLLLGGWVIGAMLTYWIGVWFARPALAFFVTEEKLSHYEQFISKKTRFWMVLLFCLAVPSEIPGFILGAMRYDFAKFISAIIIAETIYALGSVSVAQNILDKEIISVSGGILFLAVLITTASIMLIHIKRARDSKR